MNQQIKKLISEANLHVARNAERGSRQETIDDMKDEKLAQLIIEECAEFARQHNLEKADRSHMIHRAIKQHFGLRDEK